MPARAQAPQRPNKGYGKGLRRKNCGLRAGNPVPRRGVFPVWRPCRPSPANDEGVEAMNQSNNNQNPSQQQREQQQREQQNQQKPGQKPDGQNANKDDGNKDAQKR